MQEAAAAAEHRRQLEEAAAEHRRQLEEAAAAERGRRQLEEAERRRREAEEARQLLLLVEERKRQQEAAAKKKDQAPQAMDGVHCYPLIKTMNEQERARHRAPKRKETGDNAPKSSLQQAVLANEQLRVEQDDDILMEGRAEVWKTSDDKSAASYFSFGPLFGGGKQKPTVQTVGGDDDDEDSI